MQCCSTDTFEATQNSLAAPSNLNHSVCPSKLSKRELEDIYFALVQSNMDLKRIINNQSEKQKFLTTKLQRMMNTQKLYMGAGMKECCSATKALVQEQKTVIQELRRINENLKQQVKQLNMKLCSTKQFLKSPMVGAVSIHRLHPTNRASSARSSSGKKITSTDVLNGRKQSVAEELKNTLTSGSCQHIDDQPSQPTKTINTRATFTDSEDFPRKVCDENKCQTLMNELKREIVVLHETLESDHGKNSSQVNNLTKEVDKLQSKNAQMKIANSEQYHSLNKTFSENQLVKQKLQEAQRNYDDLEAKLKIERARVAELKTQLKATNMANNTIKTVETQISKDVNNLRAFNKPDPQTYPEQYKYPLGKEYTKVPNRKITPNGIRKPTRIPKSKHSVSPNISRNWQERVKASTSPAKIVKSVHSSTSRRTVKSVNSSASPRIVKSVDSSIIPPTKIKKPQYFPKSSLNKRETTASPTLPRKVKETSSSSTSTKTQKYVDSSTSPMIIKKTENKPLLIQRDNTVSPKSPRKIQETTNASASPVKIKQNVDSSTSPIFIKKTNQSHTSQSFIKKEKTLSPKSLQKLQGTVNASASAATFQKFVNSSTSPKSDESRKSPLINNKTFDSSTLPLKEHSHTHSPPVEIRKSVDSSEILIGIKKTKNSHILPSNINDVVSSSPVRQDKTIQETYPDKIGETQDTSTSPIIINKLEEPSLEETDDSSTLSMKLRQIVDNYSPQGRNETADTSTSPKTLEGSKSPDKVPKLEDITLSIENSETENSPTNLPKVKDKFDFTMPTSKSRTHEEHTHSPPVEIRKSVDPPKIPIGVKKTKNSHTLPSNINDVVSSSPVRQDKTIQETYPDKIVETRDTSASPIIINKLEESNLEETVDSSTLSMKSREIVNNYSPQGRNETADTSTSPKTLEGSKSPDKITKLEDITLSIKNIETEDPPTNLPIVKDEFDFSMPTSKSRTREENIYETKNSQSLSPKLSTYSSNRRSSENKSQQRHPEAKPADNNEIPDPSQESFMISCHCCRCPPIKIVNNKNNNNTEHDQSITQDRCNKNIDKNIDNSLIKSHPQNGTITPYKGESKDSGDIYTDIKNISEENKIPNKDNQATDQVTLNDDNQDKDIILNIYPEENAPLRVDLSNDEKTPSPRKLDDSGFADANKSITLNDEEQKVMNTNTQLLDKIAYLQAQLESLQRSIPLRSENPLQEPKNIDQFGTDEPTTSKSIARMKYTAEREADLLNKDKPEKRFQVSEGNSRQSTPISNKSLQMSDRNRQPSLVNQPQFVPAQLFDQDGDNISTLHSEVKGNGEIATKDGTKQYPSELEMNGFDMTDKRVSLKLIPENMEYINDNRHQIPGPVPLSSAPTSKYSDSIPTNQPVKDDDSPRPTKTSFAQRNFYLAPEDTPLNNRSEKPLQSINTTQKKYTEDDFIQAPSPNLPDNESQRAQRTPDFNGSQAIRPDLNYPNLGLAKTASTEELNQNTKKPPTSLKALAELKDQYANAKESPMPMKYQGLVPNDCSCPTDPDTGLCFCDTSNAPDTSSSHGQKPTLLQRKSPVPLAITSTSYIVVPQKDTTNAKNTVEPLSVNLNDEISPKADKYAVKSRTYDELIDSKSLISEEVRNPPEDWPREKHDSLISENSLPPNYLQLKRPLKLKSQQANPVTPMPNLEPVMFRMDKGEGELQTAQTAPYSPDVKKNQETFTVEAPNKVGPGNGSPKKHNCLSPDNTDQEISSMSDLPSEKTTNSPPRRTKQYPNKNTPKEDKAIGTVAGTGTVTRSTTPMSTATPQSDTTPISATGPLSTSTPFSLSEGEVPLDSDSPKARPTSVEPSKLANTQTPQVSNKTPSEQPASTTVNVEQALLAISEELARCRQLLEKKPQKGKPPKQLNGSADNVGLHCVSEHSKDSSISLRAVSGQPHIGEHPQKPRVMFTMHFGSMVLSDEAVLSYRDLDLVLTWKFYDQNVAMSHMRPGRVVHFDFSTEYDLKLTDDFLNYLKNEELSINVCEANKHNIPLAYCSLPLREALLHTNRRFDLSLALMAGPSAQSGTIDTRDEMGVLDLWCMLRADANTLPLINQTIAASRSPSGNIQTLNSGNKQRFSTPLMAQVNEEDQDDLRVSEDLSSSSPIKRLPKRGYHDMDRGQEIPYNSTRPDRMRFDDYQTYRHTGGRLNTLDSTYPMYDHGFERKGSNTPTDDVSGVRRESSGIIINNVPLNIRTETELKQVIQDRFIPDAKLKKSERLQGQETSLDEILKKANQRKQANMGGRQDSHLSVFSHKTGDSSQQTQPLSSANQHHSQQNLLNQKYETVAQILGARRHSKTMYKRIQTSDDRSDNMDPYIMHKTSDPLKHLRNQSIDITILWLALNEECNAMNDPKVERLYVAYTFLGYGGAELETPMSLPKPKNYQDKCHFNFKKSFQLNDQEFRALGRLAQKHSRSSRKPSASDCVIFTVVSEPMEDPLSLNNCEDIGTAYLFFGDLLAYSAGSDTYTDVIPVLAVEPTDAICGVLAVRVDGLELVRKSIAKQLELTIG